MTVSGDAADRAVFIAARPVGDLAGRNERTSRARQRCNIAKRCYKISKPKLLAATPIIWRKHPCFEIPRFRLRVQQCPDRKTNRLT